MVFPLPTGRFTGAHSLPCTGVHARSQPQSGGWCGFRTWGLGGVPWTRDPWVSFSQCPMGGLPAGVLKAVSRNHIPLIPFDSLTCLLPNPPPRLSSCMAVPFKSQRCLWREPASHTAGAPGCSLTSPPSHHERGHCHFVQPALCCPGERQCGQSSSYPLHCVQTRFLGFFFVVLCCSALFPPAERWNLFSGRPNFCKSSLTHGCLPKPVSWFSPTVLQRDFLKFCRDPSSYSMGLW